MNYISFIFFLFFAVLFAAYYLCPQKAQRFILLAGSMLFYAYAAWPALIVLAAETVITFLLAKAIKKGSNRKLAAATAVIFNIAVLVLLMYVPAMSEGFLRGNGIIEKFIAPLGISYYTLMMTGYVVDVYREDIEAETDITKLMLFAFYFPSIVQGPINRYKELTPQLCAGHAFDRDVVFKGILRFGYGMFKKMVVANRIAVFIEAVNSKENAAGVFVLLDILLFFLQLYADFSGCVDMSVGMSSMLGIRLPENFRHPFKSGSVDEFWRRWHITLGNWLRDYIYYPIIMSSAAKRFVRVSGKNKKLRKRIVASIAFFILFFIMGIWHGAGVMYALLGLQYAVLFVVTFLLSPVSRKFAQAHPALEKDVLWRSWQKVRTALLIWPVLLCADTPRKFSEFTSKIFTGFHIEKLFDGGLFRFDLNVLQWILMLAGFITMIVISKIEDRKEKGIADIVAEQRFGVRILIYWYVIIMIILSLSIKNTEFIYAQY